MAKQTIITPPQNQQGATLIVVLLVLILVLLAGAIAVRKSNTDLRLATASQVDSLLFISAEQPNAKIEQQAKDPNSDMFSTTRGLMGYFMSEAAEANANDELVLCYRPKEANPLNLFKAGILQPNPSDPTKYGWIGDKERNEVFCNAQNSNSYTSDRNATMVQMAITRGAPSASSTSVPLGTDLHDARAKNYSINVDSAAAIPSYGSTPDSKINACFKKPLTKKTASTVETASECLSKEGVPNKTVTQNYIAQYQEAAPESSDTVLRKDVTAPTSTSATATPASGS